MFGSAAHKTLVYFRLGLHTVCEVKSLIFPFSTLAILLESLERPKEGEKVNNNLLFNMGGSCGLNK